MKITTHATPKEPASAGLGSGIPNLLGEALRQCRDPDAVLRQVCWWAPVPARGAGEDSVNLLHPLAAVVLGGGQAHFRAALEAAHAATPRRIHLQAAAGSGWVAEQTRNTSITDWVESGVMATVCRHGDVAMLADLLEVLDRRRGITQSVLYTIDVAGNTKGLAADPWLALAQNPAMDQAGFQAALRAIDEHVRKDLETKAPSGNGKNRWRGHHRINRIRCHTHALRWALGQGNEAMVDAIVGLGHAQATKRGLVEAVEAGHMALALRVLDSRLRGAGIAPNAAWALEADRGGLLWALAKALSKQALGREARDVERRALVGMVEAVLSDRVEPVSDWTRDGDRERLAGALSGALTACPESLVAVAAQRLGWGKLDSLEFWQALATAPEGAWHEGARAHLAQLTAARRAQLAQRSFQAIGHAARVLAKEPWGEAEQALVALAPVLTQGLGLSTTDTWDGIEAALTDLPAEKRAHWWQARLDQLLTTPAPTSRAARL